MSGWKGGGRKRRQEENNGKKNKEKVKDTSQQRVQENKASLKEGHLSVLSLAVSKINTQGKSNGK